MDAIAGPNSKLADLVHRFSAVAVFNLDITGGTRQAAAQAPWGAIEPLKTCIEVARRQDLESFVESETTAVTAGSSSILTPLIALYEYWIERLDSFDGNVLGIGVGYGLIGANPVTVHRASPAAVRGVEPTEEAGGLGI